MNLGAECFHREGKIATEITNDKLDFLFTGRIGFVFVEQVFDEVRAHGIC